MLTVTIDEKSASAASAGQLDLEPLYTLQGLPISDPATKCVQIGEHGYVLSRSFQAGDALLTVSLQPDGPLSSLAPESREEAVARLVRCTSMLASGRVRSLPVSWRAFHENNRLSFQADRFVRRADGGRTDAGRIVVDLQQDAGLRVFAFLLDRSREKHIGRFQAPAGMFKQALGGVSQALAAPEPAPPRSEISSKVTLDGTLPEKVRGFTTDDWYSIRLTSAQRRFVDHPLTTSARLVGPAGSGKTVALVVKCLKDLRTAIAAGRQPRFLFLTHATATATAIENLVLSMEPEKGYDVLASDKPPLVITTLYALANRQMRYDLDELTPISLDGYEGRAFQADVLNDEIEKFRGGDWVTFKSRCSKPFVAYMDADKSSTERRFFLWEVLNEFACVLDAEGVRSGAARRDQYLNEKRKGWMMVLETREEREVVLALYEAFRTWLREAKAIGGDQMITDFLNHLDSFRWEATRAAEGYDAVFVDELHLFNRQERMTFKQLLKAPSAPPSVFMAYDAKQSPRDSFLKLPGSEAQQFDLWKDARLGKVEKIELVDVFRYTPQIAAALARIDESFPGQDLDDDWPKYSGVSRTDDGPIPTLCTLKSTIATHALAFRRARLLQQRAGRERKVAVLCASNELFRRYLEATEMRDSFQPITSREEASSIPHSAKRFVFSMPEYVAGLQFDTVLLTEVNKDEVPEGPFAAAALRKFVSQVYLGASRAERQLEIYASADHGGVAPLLSRAVLERAIHAVEEKDLERS